MLTGFFWIFLDDRFSSLENNEACIFTYSVESDATTKKENEFVYHFLRKYLFSNDITGSGSFFFLLRRQAILVAFFYLSVLPTISNQGSLTSVGKFQTELGKAWALEIASRRRKEGWLMTLNFLFGGAIVLVLAVVVEQYNNSWHLYINLNYF